MAVDLTRDTIPELIVVAEAPTPHGAVATERAGVELSAGDGDDVGEIHHRSRREVRIVPPIPEHACFVALAPAEDLAIRAQSAGVVHARGKSDGIDHALDLRRRPP